MTAIGLAALVIALLLAQVAVVARPRLHLRRPAPPPWLTGVGAAVVVGAGLRLAWVIWASRTPVDPYGDPGQYLGIADGFLDGHLPVFPGGGATALYVPGYPAVLAPFVGLADIIGVSAVFAASLVNTVAGVLSIALTAPLAGRWISPRARIPAAWLVAVCPALVYWTSSAHAETVFTAMALGVMVLVTGAVDRSSADGRAVPSRVTVWVGIGALVGFTILTRSQALALLIVPALAIRARSGAWAGSVRTTGLVLAGAALLLGPWMVRNGVQVGAWTPTSTGNAAAICAGHHDRAEPYFNRDPELEADCFRFSPYDDERLALGPPGTAYNGPDEARWYREASALGIRWAFGHPADEVQLAARKFVEAWSDEHDAVPSAGNYAEGPDWAGRWTVTLGLMANLWLWAVELLAVVALVTVPAVRRALPLWGPIVVYTVMIMATLSFPHYRLPAVPLLAMLASAHFARARIRVRDG